MGKQPGRKATLTGLPRPITCELVDSGQACSTKNEQERSAMNPRIRQQHEEPLFSPPNFILSFPLSFGSYPLAVAT